jgi:hypothetical protein
LALLKAHYCHQKIVKKNGVMFAPLLDGFLLNQHASFFVVIMNNNFIAIMLPSFDQNPTSWLGKRLRSSGIL